MKVTTDFLPTQYKSFILDTKSLGLMVVIGIGSVAFCGFQYQKVKDESAGLDEQKAAVERRISQKEASIAKKSYDQETIKRLIDKFKFIQTAVGQRDFPYLRFYHHLELAIPIDESTNQRRLAIKQMDGNGGQFKIRGLALHWDDLLRFERNLLDSSFNDPIQNRNKKNFTSFTMGGWKKTEEGIEFDAEFTFNPG